eukprot:440764_1
MAALFGAAVVTVAGVTAAVIKVAKDYRNKANMCKKCNGAFNEDDKLNGNITHISNKKIHKQCPLRFKHHHNFDKNGIIYWLGTNKGKSNTFKNPVLRGHV